MGLIQQFIDWVEQKERSLAIDDYLAGRIASSEFEDRMGSRDSIEGTKNYALKGSGYKLDPEGVDRAFATLEKLKRSRWAA